LKQDFPESKATMLRPAMLALLSGLILTVSAATSSAANFLELGQRPSKETILSIGRVPVKKNISLDLGGIRTGEAQLPPAPLSRSERMALRSRMAVSRQRDVSNARRQRVAQKQTPFDEDEFPVDENGEAIFE
jgi:hypothetical protein